MDAAQPPPIKLIEDLPALCGRDDQSVDAEKVLPLWAIGPLWEERLNSQRHSVVEKGHFVFFQDLQQSCKTSSTRKAEASKTSDPIRVASMESFVVPLTLLAT